MREAVTVLRRAAMGSVLFTPLAAAPPAHYGDRSLPVDPLFNLPYDPSQVHFESIALDRVAQCAPLLGSLGHGTGQAKLFGALSNGRGRVLIVGDEDVRAPRGLSGTVLVLRGDGCRSSGPLLALRRTRISDPDLDPGLTDAEVTSLLHDILSRYARAFGGKDAFLAWADRLTQEAVDAQRASPDMPCPLLYTSMFTPPMRRVLEAFRRS
jgi:hypothetical protein